MNTKISLWFVSRLVIILMFTSKIQQDLFLPFLSADLNLLDPWSSWIVNSDRLEAFPYGYIMFVFFIPAILIYRLVNVYFGLNLSLEILVMITLIFCEFYLYKFLKVFKDVKSIAWYRLSIFSPLAIYITFIYGQIDVIPSSLIALLILFISRNLWFKAGLALGCAIAAKFSFMLILPFFILFFISKKVNRKNGLNFLKGLLPGVFVFLIPVTYSPGYRQMVIGTPEVIKTLDTKIDIGASYVYLVPILYLLVLVSFWALNYISNFILIGYSGSALLMIGLTQTDSVGWFYWSIPFLIYTLKSASSRTFTIVSIWQLSILTYFVYKSGEIPFRFKIESGFAFTPNQEFLTMVYTFNLVLGSFIVLKLFSESLKFGDIYSLSKKPISIGIAGDSGTGKDLLTNNIANLFKDEEVALLLGDDYHLYEREDTFWLNNTHLAPDSNDLELMGRHFRSLVKRQEIFAKHYDHKIGKFTPPRRIESSQIIIMNGLHALLFPGYEMLDLKVFLSMDEELRISLKMKRDKSQRDHSDFRLINEIISKRKPHYHKFIEPQKLEADLCFNVIGNSNDLLRLSVEIESKDKVLLHDLRKSYNSVAEIPATLTNNGEDLTLTLDPANFSSEDALLIMQRLIPTNEQLFLTQAPSFPSGVEGVMTLACLLGVVRKRLNHA